MILPLNWVCLPVRSKSPWDFSLSLHPSDLITFIFYHENLIGQIKPKPDGCGWWEMDILDHLRKKFHIYFWVPCACSSHAPALEWHIFGISHHRPIQSSDKQSVSSISLEVAVHSKHIHALPCFIRACWWSRCLHHLLYAEMHACHCFVVIVVFLHLLCPYNQKILCRLCCFKGCVGPAPPTGNNASW